MSTVQTITSPELVGRGSRIHRLLIVHSASPADAGRSLVISGGPMILGRATADGVCVLGDTEVSRKHAEFALEGEAGCVMRDLESRNGVFVNGTRTAVAELMSGDVIRLGSTILLYQMFNEADRELLLDTGNPLSAMVGSSFTFKRLRRQINLAAPGTLSVLVTGATGVGKERVAHAIHEGSGRTGPFVAVNCGALPESLAESELFGHVGGAFTGAQRRDGLFAHAQGGTLFLDEVGEMKLALQAKLLRALATGEVRPVGSDVARVIDVRVVAATNVDVATAMADARFRSDLYARLAGHLIEVPALAERREDVLLLLTHFLRERRLHVAITADAAEALLIYDWPFNVRELEQLVGRLEPVVRGTRRVEVDDLPEPLRAPLEPRRSARRSHTEPSVAMLGVRRDVPPSRDELLLVIQHYAGNISEVSAFFGKNRRQIYRWIERCDIDLSQTRS